MNEEKTSAEIIKGPWKKTINTPTEDQLIKAEQLAFCDEISHSCLMAVITILVENGIDATEKSFIKDITFIQETIKSSILKTNNIHHPLQVLVDMTTDLSIDPDNTPFCELDEHTIDDMIASYNAVMEPDDDLS
jgi:hypothetical protein